MSSTNFLNSKQRRIFQSEKGAFFVKTAVGKKSYGPKAAFRKAGADGSVRKVTASNTNVPKKIAPSRKSGANKAMTKAAALRRAMKARQAKAAARGPRSVKFGSAEAQKMMAKLMNKTYAPPKAKAGARPARARAVRKNAGVKRGMRTPNQGVQYRMIFKTPPRRKPAKAKAMIATPGGTIYRNSAHMRRRKAASLKKRQLNANPFAALMNMRVAGARQ